MRSVWRLRNVTFASLLVLAALLLLARGTDEAKASPFVPSLTPAALTIAPLTAGATADITSTSSWLNFPSPNRSLPTGIANSTPGDWGMYAANPADTVATTTDGIPIGTATGSDNVLLTLGLLNSACAINIPISFTSGSQPPIASPPAGATVATTALLDASTDNSAGNTIAPGAGFSALVGDTIGGANGVMDGAERWNTLLAALNLPAPRERQVATTDLFGTTIWVDRPTYNPGDLDGLEESLGFATGQLPLAEGFFTLTIIQNFSPILSPTPSLVTDHCGLSISTTQCGRAPITTPGVCPAVGTPHRTNPTTVGTKLFFLRSVSDRDADTTDGLVNSRDTCPFNNNLGTDADSDGIDDACDAAATPFNPDVDGDTVLNRGDNCPQDGNITQTDFQAPPQPLGGPRFDAIGDACDGVISVGNPLGLGNLTVPDGHFHSSPKLARVCIGIADADSDGFCDLTELGLGSDPGNPASTPEHITILSTCSDGLNNDAPVDGNTDLADTGCQLPDHDIAIRKISGDTVVGGASDCQPNAPNGCGYNIILRNNTSAVEEGQLGVSIDPIPGAGCSAPTAVLHGGSAKPVLNVAGPINNDGDNDVEFLLIVDVTIPANSQRTVNLGVVYPTCAPPAVPGTPADYIILADLCHADDIAPLGLFGLQGCQGAADGGQDRLNLGNDAPVIKVINDVDR